MRTEEFWALQDGETLTLDDGTHRRRLVGADPPRGGSGGPHFADGDLAGWPALTRRPVGAGAAWYLATRLDADGLQGVTDALIAEAGLAAATGDVPPGVEAVRRVADDGRSWLFVLNHTDRRGQGRRRPGHELLRDEAAPGTVVVAAGAVAVVRED